MYKAIIRPLFFKFQPEEIHYKVFDLIKFTSKVPGMKGLYRALYNYKHPSLEREVFGLKFDNPLGLAAGFDKDAKLYNELGNFGFGFIEIGTITPKAQDGNPKPRLFRLPADKALINRMGFNNGGIDNAVSRLKDRKTKVLIGGNIGKNKLTPNENAADDYIKCFDGLFDYVDYFVVNVSSPNTPNLRALQDKEPLTALLNTLQIQNKTKSNPKPILLKIAPDLSNEQLDDIVGIVSKTKIAGIIATNTTIDRSALITSNSEIEAMGAGGLSGKPVKDRSTAVIAYLHKQMPNVPIIGVGGIFTAEDAIEKLKAGASLIQVYTGFIYEGPAMIRRINRAIKKAGL
jgi:dihydroorotate dehydrogenase